MDRRSYLRGTAAAGAFGLAGCLSRVEDGLAERRPSDDGPPAFDVGEFAVHDGRADGASLQRHARPACDAPDPLFRSPIPPDEWPTNGVTPARTGAHPTATAPRGSLSRRWRSGVRNGVVAQPALGGPTVSAGRALVYGGEHGSIGRWLETFAPASGERTRSVYSHRQDAPTTLDGTLFRFDGVGIEARRLPDWERRWVTDELDCDADPEACKAYDPGLSGGLPALAGIRLVPDDDALFALQRGVLLQLDAATGEERWRVEHDRSWPRELAVTAEHVLLASPDGVAARDREDGTLLWTADDVAVDQHSLAVSDAGTVLVGAGPAVVALDACDGTRCWTFEPAGTARAGPFVGVDLEGAIGVAAADGRAYVAADRLYALDAASGAVRWSWRPPAERGVGRPAVVDGLVFTTGPRRVYALDGAERAVRLDATLACGERELLQPYRPTVLQDCVLASTSSAVVAACADAAGPTCPG